MFGSSYAWPHLLYDCVAPEAIFFIIALSDGSLDFAIGAISGSIIVVSTIAVGAVLLISSRTLPFKLGHNRFVPDAGVVVQARFMVLGTILGSGSVLAFGFTVAYGVLGVLLYVMFVVYTLSPKRVAGWLGRLPGVGRPLKSFLTVVQHPREGSDDGDYTVSSGVVMVAVSGVVELGDDGEGGDVVDAEVGLHPPHHHHHTLRAAGALPPTGGAAEYYTSVTADGRVAVKAEGGHRSAVYKGTFMLTLGAILIALFSDDLVTGLAKISADAGLDPLVVAFFVAPLASEAPEILGAVAMSRKGSTKMVGIALSNLVGGTVAKVSILLGIMCFFGVFGGDSLQWEWRAVYVVSFVAVIVCGVAIGTLVTQLKRVEARMGYACLLLYGISAAACALAA